MATLSDTLGVCFDSNLGLKMEKCKGEDVLSKRNVLVL